MTYEEITYLLGKVDEHLEAIRESAKQKKPDKGSIRYCLMDLRSALDYGAEGIKQHLLHQKKDKVYFPYGETPEKFQRFAEGNLPGLKAEFPAVYSAIEQMQPFNNKHHWLLDLVELSNKVDHRTMEGPSAETEYTVSYGGKPFVRARNAKLAVIHGCTFNGVPQDTVVFDNVGRPSVYPTSDHGRLGIDMCGITSENVIIIDGTRRDAIPLIEQCRAEVAKFAEVLKENFPDF